MCAPKSDPLQTFPPKGKAAPAPKLLQQGGAPDPQIPLLVNPCKGWGKYKIQNTKYKIQNTKYKIQNTKFKIQNTKYKIQNTKSIYELK